MCLLRFKWMKWGGVESRARINRITENTEICHQRLCDYTQGIIGWSRVKDVGLDFSLGHHQSLTPRPHTLLQHGMNGCVLTHSQPTNKTTDVTQCSVPNVFWAENKKKYTVDLIEKKNPKHTFILNFIKHLSAEVNYNQHYWESERTGTSRNVHHLNKHSWWTLPLWCGHTFFP